MQRIKTQLDRAIHMGTVQVFTTLDLMGLHKRVDFKQDRITMHKLSSINDIMLVVTKNTIRSTHE